MSVNMKDITQEKLKAFFADEDLVKIVEGALVSYTLDPASKHPDLAPTHWLFNTNVNPRDIPDEAFGRNIRVKMEAVELILAAFAGMKLMSQRNEPKQKGNEAR